VRVVQPVLILRRELASHGVKGVLWITLVNQELANHGSKGVLWIAFVRRIGCVAVLYLGW
jgi:hypothetical protein